MSRERNDKMADNLDLRGRSEVVFAVTIVVFSLATIVVSLRILSRGFIVKKIHLDDYFILLAWAVAFGLSFAICYGCAYGLGRHERNIPADWQYTLKQANYAFSILYQPALMATKSSILVFFLTFTKANDIKIFRWACWATLFFVNAGGLALTLITVFQCTPISALFKTDTPANAKCTDILTIYLASIPLNITTDFALLFLPMPILTSMRLPRKQKWILVITFSFGLLAIVVDVVRISYLQVASQMRIAEIQDIDALPGALRTAEATDSSFYLAFSFMWSAVEVAIGIIVASVPALKPLVARFIPSMLRDPSDASSVVNTFSSPNPEVNKAAPPIPDDVHDHDFGRAPSAEDDEPMDILEFLSGRRDRARSTAETAADEEEAEQMGMVDFLTTPDMALERSETMLTNTTRHTLPVSPNFFDFVVQKQRKCFLHMSNRESFIPLAGVTVLFFIWGFEYGLLDSLNRQFQMVASVTSAQAVGLRSAYYLGYFFGPLTVGNLILKHWGFKACYPIGLCIYASGCLIYWPAAVLTSWGTFLATNFIVGFGLSLLEVSANAFIALCGPPEYGEMRLNLSQGIQACGTVIAPLIANAAFVDGSSPSLVNTQWAYLGISLATVLLAVVYFYAPLPEATDEELEDAAERIDGANKAQLGRIPVTWIVLGLGVCAQFCYVGGQEVLGSHFNTYVAVVAPRFDQVNYFAVAHTAFAVSRFMAAGLGFWIKPRILLVMCLSGLIIFNALAMSFTGTTGLAMIIMAYFWEGPLFGLIFAQGIRGQGRNTRMASVLITSAVSGGAVFSPISYALLDSGRSVPFCLVVAVAAFGACLLFALGLSVSRKTRLVVDPIQDVTGEQEKERGSSTSSRASRALSFLSIRIKKPTEMEYRERKR